MPSAPPARTSAATTALRTVGRGMVLASPRHRPRGASVAVRPTVAGGICLARVGAVASAAPARTATAIIIPETAGTGVGTPLTSTRTGLTITGRVRGLAALGTAPDAEGALAVCAA